MFAEYKTSQAIFEEYNFQGNSKMSFLLVSINNCFYFIFHCYFYCFNHYCYYTIQIGFVIIVTYIYMYVCRCIYILHILYILHIFYIYFIYITYIYIIYKSKFPKFIKISRKWIHAKINKFSHLHNCICKTIFEFYLILIFFRNLLLAK